MDLITLVAACALTADPKLMHALIWHQSGGEPWSFSVPGERQPQVYRSAREAVHEAHAARSTGLPIRIGLTGLATDSASATLAMFLPCPNISMAARQITQLVECCKVLPRFTANSTRCAIAAYRGSWDRPDSKFADAVLTSLAKGDAPNFDMPDEIGDRSDDVATEPSLPGRRISRARSTGFDDQQQGWSSALFPARSKQLDGTSSSNPDADRLQDSGAMNARPMAVPSHDDRLFVRRLPERRPQ
jgi:hypothetical protein